MFFTTDGRYVLDGMTVANDGTRVRNGTMLLEDGTRLYYLVDHTIPYYEFTSNNPEKALLGTYISYDIVLRCLNNADPENGLTANVPIPAGFNLINAISNEGEYHESTGKWDLLLNNDEEAILNLILRPISVGNPDQLITLEGTESELTNTFEVVSSDPDGDIACHEANFGNALNEDNIYILYKTATKYQIFFKPTPTSHWMSFYFERDTNTGSNKDVWRHTYIYQTTIEGSIASPGFTFVSTAMTLSGGWEYAIMINGSWIGTVHGNETNTSMSITVDGVNLALGLGQTTNGETIVIETTSDLYHPTSGLKIGETTIIYTYTKEGVDMQTSIKWTNPDLISVMYWPMFPIKRDVDVCTKGILDGESVVQDMSVAGFTEVHKDSAGAEMWNDNNGFRARVEILNPEEALNNYADNGTAKTYFSNTASPAYNKLYFTRVYGTGVIPSVNEVWTCHTLFTFEYPLD